MRERPQRPITKYHRLGCRSSEFERILQKDGHVRLLRRTKCVLHNPFYTVGSLMADVVLES